MDLHPWLDAERGRASRLAAHLKLTKFAVSLWRKTGVPMDRMQAIEEFSDGSVTVAEMLRHAFVARSGAKPKNTTVQGAEHAA